MYKNNLYDIRKNAGKSQSDMAKELKMNANVYGRYERGERDMPLSLAIEIAQMFNVSIDYVAGYSQSEQGIFYDAELATFEDTVLNPLYVSGNDKEVARELARRIENQIKCAINDLKEYKKKYDIE